MAKTAHVAQDATALLAQLKQRASRLASVASLQASHAELREAAQAGELVCWNACKLHSENSANGIRRYAPGESLPKVDAQHTLLEPDKRLVTTHSRWQAQQAYRRLADYLRQGSLEEVEAQMRHATAAHNAATDEVQRLQLALPKAQQSLREAEAERLKADAKLRSFVERAPSPVSPVPA
jgi:hypothetical protein